MDILTGECPDRAMAHVRERRAQEAVRWYVLTLPTAGGGRDKITPSKGLDAELSRRERRGETLFEYFAPSYVEARKVGGRMVNTRRPLLYNYVFIHASENEIFCLKRTLPLYNFLPRVSSGGRSYFPYLSDREMDTLRWVAASYSNELPVYVPDSGRLLRGDRVRITSGPFAGMEAEVVIQPGGGHKDVMVRILDCMWVPLLEVKTGEYELIELNTKGKRVYTHLDNDRLSEGLHEALGRYHASGGVSEEDTRLAREVLRGYASLHGGTDVIRCRIYSLLLPAYRLLGEEAEFERLHSTLRGMLPAIKAVQSRALLLVTLYGCTDSSLYQRMAHEVVDPWRDEVSPKKSKSVLLRRLRDYDRWLGH
ncbi:transcriptional regulator [uncultured Parabacteroides sp.]|uniref:transcription termination/antitermination protein NusG n=1 Tax=uncultured Parabacteroides sp. TaxID=512312 RepID=UPI002620E706|nr:transcriptional regulator [uncultured Parabacteroides sp.]